MEDRKMAEFLAWFCQRVIDEDLHISEDTKGNIWIDDENEVGDQQISFEEVVRRYNKTLPVIGDQLHRDDISEIVITNEQYIRCVYKNIRVALFATPILSHFVMMYPLAAFDTIPGSGGAGMPKTFTTDGFKLDDLIKKQYQK